MPPRSAKKREFNPEKDPWVWAVVFPEKQPVQIADLYEVQEIADRYEKPWSSVIALPLARLDMAKDVIAAAARRRGIDPPDLGEEATPRQISDFFDRVPDDLPTEFIDGLPPEGDDSKTAGSSS